MLFTLMIHEPSNIELHKSLIQASWSPDERQRRAKEGQRRTAELFALLGLLEIEPAILAVGAPVYEDHKRIAG